MGRCLTGLLLLFATIALSSPAVAEPTGAPWRLLEPGLELGLFEAPTAASSGDSLVRVLRIDPERFELRLLNASAPGHGERLTPRTWCRRNDLVAAINASMYAKDYKTSVSLMRTGTHTNNPRLSKDRAVLAFDRLVPSVPPVQIIDRTCQDFDELRKHYGSLVQSIRMISCKRRNVWQQQPKKWSTAAIGMDGAGRILLIHVISLYSTHDLIDVLLELPLDLTNAMYAEGGPEAQLYVKSGELELELAGSRTGLAGGLPAWPVPNVIGVARRMPARLVKPGR